MTPGVTLPDRPAFPIGAIEGYECAKDALNHLLAAREQLQHAVGAASSFDESWNDQIDSDFDDAALAVDALTEAMKTARDEWLTVWPGIDRSDRRIA